MSSPRNHIIQCPQCGARGEFTVWDSVNPSVTPNMKAKIISGELFQWRCPQCGRVWDINYPMLYHDMPNRQLIEFRPTPEDQPRDARPNPLYAAFVRYGYTIRYAYTLEELIAMVKGV